MQYACRYCGDCWSGCNVGAKNTVGITYIADAVDHGAAVFCESRAQSISKTESGWEIVVQDLSKPGASRRIEAPIVVLAAGTLGTNELLLRAQQRGLKLSAKLGEKFSANGDDLVFADKLDEPVNAVATGFPPQAPRGAAPVGPHSMALIDLGDEHGPLWVHDGTMLAMMASLAPLEEFAEAENLDGALRLLKEGIYGDEMSRSQLLYIVAHDDASGRLRLQNDHVVVDWPGYSDAPERVRAEQKVKAMIESMGGVFDANPFAMTAFGGNRIIAHPLGGCAMGETVETRCRGAGRAGVRSNKGAEGRSRWALRVRRGGGPLGGRRQPAVDDYGPCGARDDFGGGATAQEARRRRDAASPGAGCRDVAARKSRCAFFART